MTDPVTHIDFFVKGKQLNLDEITSLMKIHPTRGFNPGEIYLGKKKDGDKIVSVPRYRPLFGVWHFSTEGLVHSSSVDEHVLFLTESLRPSAPALEKLRASSDYELGASIWYVGPAGFSLSSDSLLKLGSLVPSLSVTCFETEEDDSPDARLQ